MKRYSAHMKILEVQKIYKNEAEDLKIIFSKLVRLAERCKSMMRFSFHTLDILIFDNYSENNRVTVNTTFADAITNLEGLYLEIKVLHRKVSKDAGLYFQACDVLLYRYVKIKCTF